MPDVDLIPDEKTQALYRVIPSAALMVLRTAFELDLTDARLQEPCHTFARNRIALIDTIISERIQYPTSDGA